jgi:hypothetical protein
MEDNVLFDRFHAALEAEPRAGAYDRLRAAMNNSQAAAIQRRPHSRLRFTKMGLRITAAIAAVAILTALIVALLASHRTPVGNVPATDSRNVTAYRALILADYGVMNASTSDHCNTIADTGCAAAVGRVAVALQKWVSDLQGFQTPPRYAALDALLRAHLTQAAYDLNAAVAFQPQNNSNGFDLAMNAAVYERAWLDPASFAIEGTLGNRAASYRDALGQISQAQSNCVLGTPQPLDIACARLMSHACVITDAHSCEITVQEAATQVQGFVISIAQFPPPSSRTTQAAKLQTDLVQEDAALIAITVALLKGDANGMASGVSSFQLATGNTVNDVGAATA